MRRLLALAAAAVLLAALPVLPAFAAGARVESITVIPLGWGAGAPEPEAAPPPVMVKANMAGSAWDVCEVYVPLRAAVEALGWRVDWRGDYALLDTGARKIVIGAPLPKILGWGVRLRPDGKYAVLRTSLGAEKIEMVERAVVDGERDLWVGRFFDICPGRLYVQEGSLESAGCRVRVDLDGGKVYMER